MILTRKRPRFCLAVGIFLCGLKYLLELVQPSSGQRKAAMQATTFGILPANDGTPEDARMVDAWARVEAEGRTSHDLTNLAIEWNRRWLPYSTKFIASFGVYLALALIIVTAIWILK